MTLTEALKAAEDMMEQVAVAGEDNWNRMSDSKKLIRMVRKDIERQQEEAQKNESNHASVQHGDTETDAGTV